MSVRVAIRSGCNGMGSCARLAPAVFRMDAATGTARVVVDDASAHKEAVLAAARSCPFVAVEVDGVPVDEPIDGAVVTSCERLTPDIVALRLARSGFRFTPGQYVFLRLTDERGDFFRTYSVVSAADGQVTLCIRLVANGRAGRVLTSIRPGTTVGLSRPKGLFSLKTPDQPKLFLTGGTGLAPVIPMCEAAPSAAKLVIVGARTPVSLFWLQRLADIPNTRVIAVVQTPDGAWTGPVGTVVDPLADLDLEQWPEVYTCGSPAMVETVRRTLLARGVAEDRLFCDSFVPSGTLPPAPAAPAPTRPPRDWAGLMRRLHLVASGPLALLILFYALSGFVANRADLFMREGTETAARTLPEGIPLETAAVGPVLAALVGDGARVEQVAPGPKAEVLDARGGHWTASVDPATRQVRLVQHGTLPATTELQPAAVAKALTGRLSGHPDLDHAEAGDDGVELDFASVWGTHHVKVAPDRTWTASSVAPPLVVSLVDLHRSKHAGVLQRLVVDGTALGLAFLTLTGVAMAVMTATVRRRRQALLLLGGSAALLVLLLIAR